MFKKLFAAPSSFRRRHLLCLSPLILLACLVAATTRVDLSGDFEGVYLLKETGRLFFTVQNDLYLGDERKLLFRLDFEPLYGFFSSVEKPGTAEPFLSYEWSNRNGRGFIMNHYPDGTRLVTCFGRFRDSDGEVPKGLFVGGGLPVSKNEGIEVTMNETGMAFYTGKRWQHLWCSVNEALASSLHPEKMLTPSQWGFRGSRILEKGRKRLVLKSSHEVKLDGVPLSVDRYAFLRAGDKYFVLAVRVRNTGASPVTYHYVYGDEPWVGEFGTSVGNVGWVKDKIYYYEGEVDPKAYSFAGMYDYGNKMILGGRGNYSGIANFVEWLGDSRPDLVYFSNSIGTFAQEAEKVPLYSKDNRVIFLQWSERTLRPGESHLYTLAIGMADSSAAGQLPVKPDVVIDRDDYRYLIGQ